MIVVRPERQNILSREVPEPQSAVIVRKYPRDTAAQSVLADVLEKPVKPFVEYLAERVGVSFVLTVDCERLAEEVIRLLVDHKRELIVDDLVVRQIIDGLKLSVLADHRPLASQNVVLSGVVATAQNLMRALFAGEPVLYLGGEEPVLGHAAPARENQAVYSFHL